MKIAVLISGGVDSSVALKLLQEQGYDITAFYLKIWLEDELSFLGNCPWEEDLGFVQQICNQSNISLEIINFQKEYHQEVVAYALDEIKAGRTPNSDFLCNSQIKFGKFLEAVGQHFDLVASGHYADKLIIPKSENSTEKHFLKMAKDSFKDQTYFLANLSHQQLKKVIFPLGPYLKSEVRELAKNFNLPNFNRKDSQGICFLGKIKYNVFVKYHLGVKKGEFIDINTGKVVGEHEGYYFYTIGQRKGIKLSGGPWYIVKKDISKNQVFISNHYFELQPRDHFNIGQIHWITEKPGDDQLKNLKVKVRHGENIYDCKILERDSLTVQISGSDQGFAPGQFAVFYSDGLCLGSATIL